MPPSAVASSDPSRRSRITRPISAIFFGLQAALKRITLVSRMGWSTPWRMSKWPPSEWASACSAPRPALLKAMEADTAAMLSCSSDSSERVATASCRLARIRSTALRLCISVKGEAMRDM